VHSQRRTARHQSAVVPHLPGGQGQVRNAAPLSRRNSCAKIAHVTENDLIDSEAIGTRIARAREELGLTQADVAAQLSLDRTAIAKIESGKRNVSATELVKLAAVLDRSIDWFVRESPQAVISRRADPVTGGRSPLLDRRIDQIARDVEFLEAEDLLPVIEPCRIDVPATPAEAEDAAQCVRSLLGVGNDPLTDLQRHCEALGLLAFSLELGETGGDAAYVSLDRRGVCVVNGSTDPGRRRFNLAHELGHYVFDDAYAPEVAIQASEGIERIINAFGIHLLAPRDGVQKVWDEFDDTRLAAVAIAIRYRASWTAVCAQLKTLNLISEDRRRQLVDTPPTTSDSLELGERWESELDPPAVPPDYGRRAIRAFRVGRLTPERTLELLWDTVAAADLPGRHQVPLESLRGELDPLR